MSGVVLSPRARDDLNEIWNYTAIRWGSTRAEGYIRGIQAAVQTLAAHPRRGRPCPEIRAGYLKYAVGAHVLFCRATDSGVEVVRILHQRMDFESHL